MVGGGALQQGQRGVWRGADIGGADIQSTGDAGGGRFPLAGADETVGIRAEGLGECGDGGGDYGGQSDGRAGCRQRPGQGDVVADAADGDQYIRRGGVDLAGDGGEIGCTGRVGQAQDGIKAQLLRRRFGAVANLAGEGAGVHAGEGQGAGIRAGGAGDRGEADQVAAGRRQDADDVAGVLGIDGIAGAAVVPEEALARGGDFSRGGSQSGGVGAEKEVDAVGVEEAGGVAASLVGAAGVVIMAQD